MPAKPVQVTLDFIEKINQGDADGLADLLALAHTVTDLAGDVEKDQEKLAAGWHEYLSTCPIYHIYIRQLFTKDNDVIVVGHTTGSHLNLPDEEEFHSEGVFWAATVKEGRLSAWELYNDTVENQLNEGMRMQSKSTHQLKWQRPSPNTSISTRVLVCAL